MTSPRGHSGSRALGSIKLKGTVFPPLARAVNDSSRQYFVEHQLMVQGDSMGLSGFVSKSSERVDLSPTKSPSRPVTSRPDTVSLKLAEEVKEMQNKEKQYKNKIQSLQKVIEQLKQDVKRRDSDLAAINQKLQEIEEHYKLLYNDECTSHTETKSKLKVVSQELEEKNELVEELKRKHEESMQQVKNRYETQVKQLEDDMKREITERDDKIEKMKKQMANFLKDNSWERQQQLEELTKELGKVSEEAIDLRTKLKLLMKNKKCENCDHLKNDIRKRDQKISEHEATIKELMVLCQKFETQLKQQDVLLIKFQKSHEKTTSGLRKK